MVSSDWDLALRKVCGPNFRSIQLENSPVYLAEGNSSYIYRYIYIYIYIYSSNFYGCLYELAEGKQLNFCTNWEFPVLRHPLYGNDGFEGWFYLYHKMTPPPNLGHSWFIFEGWSQILPSTKLFRHGFEQSCSAMATQLLEEKVQQHDEVVNQAKVAAGANRGHLAKQVRASACIDLRHLCPPHLVPSYHLRGLVCSLRGK